MQSQLPRALVLLVSLLLCQGACGMVELPPQATSPTSVPDSAPPSAIAVPSTEPASAAALTPPPTPTPAVPTDPPTPVQLIPPVDVPVPVHVPVDPPVSVDPPVPVPVPTPAPAPPVLGPSSIGPEPKWITYVGRYDLSRPGMARISWPGVSLLANFVGTSLTVRMDEETPGAAEPVRHNFYGVYVDDQLTVFETTGATQVYPIASNLSPGKHTVRIVKRNDPSVGTGQFLGMQTSDDGNFLLPPAPLSRRIEFIGASSVTGWGADSGGTKCTYAQIFASSNPDHAIAKMTADLLDADSMNTSYSGKGISRNSSAADTVKTIPFMYNRITPDDSNTPKWDFRGWQADVVVVDAGGVDYNFWPNVDVSAFESNYIAYIADIRAKYPLAVIYMALDTRNSGPEGIAFQLELKKLAAQIAVPNANIFYWEFPKYDYATYGSGCSLHPNEAGTTVNANALATELKKRMGWQ